MHSQSATQNKMKQLIIYLNKWTHISDLSNLINIQWLQELTWWRCGKVNYTESGTMKCTFYSWYILLVGLAFNEMSFDFRLYKGIMPLWGRQVPCKFPILYFAVRHKVPFWLNWLLSLFNFLFLKIIPKVKCLFVFVCFLFSVYVAICVSTWQLTV